MWRLEQEAGAGEAHEEVSNLKAFVSALRDPKVITLICCMLSSQAMGSVAECCFTRAVTHSEVEPEVVLMGQATSSPPFSRLWATTRPSPYCSPLRPMCLLVSSFTVSATLVT